MKMPRTWQDLRRLLTDKRTLAATGVIMAAAGGVWLKQAMQPRTLTICVFPDPTFRQRLDWRNTLAARIEEVSRIWRREVGIVWSIAKVESEDPTAYVPGYEMRRAELPHDTPCQADLLMIVSGLHEGSLTGDINPFSHSALVVDFPDQPEAVNVQRMTRVLTHLFGAPDEAKAPAVSGEQFSEPTRQLIRTLRNYPFAQGVYGLDDAWDRRATGAMRTASQGVWANPLSHTHLTLASTLSQDGRIAPAILHLREAVRVDPTNLSLRIALAGALRYDAQLDAGIAVVRDALRTAPNDARLHAALGALLVANDAYTAEEEYRIAIRLAPNDSRWYAGLGAALDREVGHVEDALTAYETALHLDSLSGQAQKGLVRVLGERATLHGQIADLEQKVADSPKDAALQCSEGAAKLKAGDYDGALKAYNRALALNPEYPKAHSDLAILLFLRHDYADAWKAVHKAQALGVVPDANFLKQLSAKAPQ
jgi:Flp pilus assembly protein TadD